MGPCEAGIGIRPKLVETDPDSSVSRAYYATFHALTALFGLRNLTFTKHSALRSALHRDLVHPGLLSKESGKDYDFLMDLRETGDYGGIAQVSTDSARQAIDKANAFIIAIATTCPELKGLHQAD